MEPKNSPILYTHKFQAVIYVCHHPDDRCVYNSLAVLTSSYYTNLSWHFHCRVLFSPHEWPEFSNNFVVNSSSHFAPAKLLMLFFLKLVLLFKVY